MPAGRARRRGRAVAASLLGAAALAAYVATAGRPETPTAAPATAEEAYRAAEALHAAAGAAPAEERPVRLAEARAAYRAFRTRYPAEPRWSAEAALGEALCTAAAGETGTAEVLLAAAARGYPDERWVRLRAMKARADLLGAPTLYREIALEFGAETEPPAVRAVARAARRAAG